MFIVHPLAADLSFSSDIIIAALLSIEGLSDVVPLEAPTFEWFVITFFQYPE